MILLFVMNLIVIVSAFLLTYRIFKMSRFIDSLIAVFILYFAQIIATEMFLGILGWLYLERLILLNLFLLVFVWFFTLNRSSSFKPIATGDSIAAILKNKTVLFGMVLILVFAAVKVSINLFNAPFGWDSLNYHFTFPVEWLKHGNLDTPITISDDPGPSYYPINGSLYFLWLILPLKSVFLADLGQVPFFFLAFLTTYAIARKLNLDKRLSFYAAGLFLLIPNFFKQLQVGYVDVMVAALFMATLNYLLLLCEEFSARNSLLYGVSLGLLIGTKTVALPYAVLLFLPLLYLVLRNSGKGTVIFIAVTAVVIFGGFSYIRNFVETANPLYPLDFKLWNWHIFKGVIDNATYRAHFKLDDYRLGKVLFHEGLGVQSLIFVFPCVLLSLPIVWLKQKGRISLKITYFLLLPLLIYLVFRYIIPLANTRYLYPLLAAGSVSAFYAFNILNIPRRIIDVLVFVCMFSSMTELAKRQEMAVSVLATLLTFFCIWFTGKYIRKIRIRPLPFVLGVTLSCLFLLIILEKYYVKNEYTSYIKMIKYSGFWPDATRAWDWLNRNTQSNNIAYVGRPVPFPLYGGGLKNNVYYVSINKTDPAKLHYFANSRYRWGEDFIELHKNLEEQGNYRSGGEYRVWLGNLLRRKAEYLFIYSLHQTKNIEFPLEDGWAKEHADKFSLVFENSTIHVYKIRG